MPSRLVTTFTLILLGATPALAADQTIKGKTFKAIDPLPGVDASKRKVFATAKESASPNTIVGNPVEHGGSLEIILSGDNPSSQTFDLPTGLSTTGKPFWRGLGIGGYQYRDPNGENGPVKKLEINLSRRAHFTMRVSVDGKKGAIYTTPPNSGTEAILVFTIHGGDRYCVQYGPDGNVRNKGDRIFQVKNPIIEGCPAVPSCTGVEVGPGCWFLGEVGEDCATTCAAAGLAYDDVTAGYAGSGGTDGQCAAVLTALGKGFDLSEPCGLGIGCAVNETDNVGLRCTEPTTAAGSSSIDRRACACQ